MVVNTMGIFAVHRWRRQRSNQSDIAPDEIGCHGRQAIVLALRPALLDRQIPALAVTGLGETLTKCTAEREPNPGWARAVKDTDHRHHPGLCTRGNRPRSRRAAEERDEITPFHCQCLPCFQPKGGLHPVPKTPSLV